MDTDALKEIAKRNGIDYETFCRRIEEDKAQLRTLVPVTEAARLLGIDRRTIQRYVKNGSVDVVQKGRCHLVDVRKVRRALGGLLSDGRNAPRSAFKPLLDPTRSFLGECAAERISKGMLTEAEGEMLPRRVLSLYATAARNGADLDFLLYCIERLCDKDHVFVLMVLEYPVRKGFCDPLRVYAAGRLRALVAGHEVDPGSKGFIGWWRDLAVTCTEAKLDVETAIVLTTSSEGVVASLELVPRWLSDAPPGSLPCVGGHHSVAMVRWKALDKGAVNRAAQKVANKLGDSEAKEQASRLAALLGLKDEEYLFNTRKWNWICDVADGGLLTQELSGRMIPYEEEQGVRRVYEVLRAASESLGLSFHEARSLLRAWRRLSHDVSSRATRVYNDNVASRQQAPFKVNFITVVAKAFGVSRGTLAKWIRDGGNGSTTAGRKRKAAKTEDLCGTVVGESEDANDRDAPEGGQKNSNDRHSSVSEMDELLYPNGRDDD
jgi:DNA-binding transcriptional MerR regulator